MGTILSVCIGLGLKLDDFSDDAVHVSCIAGCSASSCYCAVPLLTYPSVQHPYVSYASLALC